MQTHKKVSYREIEMLKDGQVCVYMNDNLDEGKSGVSQPAPIQDDDNNNYCNNPSTCVQFNLGGEGDNKIEGLDIDISK